MVGAFTGLTGFLVVVVVVVEVVVVEVVVVGFLTMGLTFLFERRDRNELKFLRLRREDGVVDCGLITGVRVVEILSGLLVVVCTGRGVVGTVVMVGIVLVLLALFRAMKFRSRCIELYRDGGSVTSGLGVVSSGVLVLCVVVSMY